MVAVGLALLFVSYTMLLYGWTRLKSMPVGILDLIVPGRYDACKWAADAAQGKENRSTGCISSAQPSAFDAGYSPGSGPGTAGGMVQIATSQLGKRSHGGKFCTEFGQWYGMNCVPWCDIFVSWVANQNGSLKEIGGKFALTTAHAAWFKANGLWHDGTAGAMPGDIMFPSHGGPGSMSGIYHVVIVTQPADSKGYVKSIAGDTGADDVGPETWAPWQIAGYGRPRYKTTVPDTPKVVAV